MNNPSERPANRIFLLVLLLVSAVANAGTPVVMTTPPAENLIGEQFCFDADFTNSDPGEAGFSPYYRLVLDPDLTLASATFIGNAVSVNSEGVFPAAPGNELTDSVTGEPVTGPENSALYTIEYPIGSVTAGAPPLSMELCLDVDANAIENVQIADAIAITPAFSLGNTATGDNGPQTGTASDFDFTPRIVSYDLTDMTAEGERPPGPAWTFPVEACANIAADRTVTPIDFAGVSPITLPSNVQFVGPIAFSGTGTSCTATTTPADLTLAPGGQIDLSCASGDGAIGVTEDICAAFDVYITDTLDATSCSSAGAINTAKHLAVQKGTSGAVQPGGTRDYTLTFQVSEFVPGISRLEATDVLPDGVTFNDDAVANFGGSTNLTGALRVIAPNTPSTGETTVTFFLTDALGTIPAASTVTVNYSASIDQDYDATGDAVLSRDTLNNSVTAEFDIDGVGNAANCTDTSGASFTIQGTTISKSVISPVGGVVQPGDDVTFRLRMEIPSGDANDIVFEDFFPLPVFDVTTISTSTDLGGANTDIERTTNDTLGLTPTSITANAGANSLTISWPNVDTAGPQVIEIDVSVEVEDEPSADNLPLSNLFQASTDNTVSDTADDLQSTTFTVRSPSLTIDKSVVGAANNYEPGDTVTWNILVTNESIAEAYDVIVTDSEPAGTNSCTLDGVSGGAGAGGDSPFDGDGFLFTSFDAPDTGALDGGASVTVTVSCVVDLDVTPNQSITNTAGTTWAAQTGATPFAPQTDEETVTTATQPQPQKSVVATSESATPETTPRPLAPGEVARFRLSLEFPEGSQTNVDLVDLVPSGLQFLDDGSGTIAFVSSTGTDITATGFDQSDCTAGTLNVIGASAAVTPTCTLPVLGGTFNNGTNVTLSLGNVDNTEIDADAEFIVLELNLVATTNRTSGDTFNNRLRVTSDQAEETSPNAQVQSVKPELEVTKVASPSTVDAGDTITYTVTIEHTGDSLADAFDIDFSDTLDGSNLDTFTFISGPAAPAGGGTCTAAGAVVDTSDPFGAGISITFESLPLGEVCEIQYSAQAQAGVVPGTLIENTASVDYDSLLGTGDPGNTTGSSQGTQESFSADDTADVDVAATVNSKIIDSTDLAHTSEVGDGASAVSPRVVSIGETVRYRLQVTLPEGSAPAFTITDTLPTGLQYVAGTARLAFVAEGAGITPTPAITCLNAGTLSFIGDETTVDGIEPDCEIAAAGAPFVSGTDPVFALGDLMNDDMDDDSEFVLLEFDARVVNEIGNQQGTDLDNTFDLSINGSSIGTTTTAFAEIIEPQLACSIDATPNPVDSRTNPSPTVSITYTLTNNGLATAFQAGAPAGDGLQIDLPAGFENITALAVTPTGNAFLNSSATPVSAADFAVSGADNDILTAASLLQLDASSSVEIAFDATLQSGVLPGSTLDADCALVYRGQVTGGSADGVRDGSGLATGSGNDPITDTSTQDDYRAEDSLTITSVPEAPEIGLAKQVTAGPTNNGDGTYTVQYRLVIENSGDVSLDNVQIDEPLATTFAGATFTVDDVTVTSTSSTLTENVGFTGTAPNTGLLDATNSTLDISETGTVVIDLTVTPGANLGDFDNQATASGDSVRSGNTVTDLSDDGATPDGNGNSDPGDDSDVTRVTLAEDAEIGIAKQVTAGPTNNGDGTYTFTYQFVVENSGDVDLDDVQVDEPLATVFAGTTFTIDSLTSTDFTVASGVFDGDTNPGMLAAGSTLDAGASGTINLTLTVTPGSNLGQFDNVATATGTAPSGATPSDTSTDGAVPDSNGNGDPADDNTPTPVTLSENAEIGLAKQLISGPINNGNGSYSLQYRLLVENTGDVALNNTQVNDDLATVYADAISFTVDALSSPTLTVSAPGFTGIAPNIGLLTGSDTLAVGASGEIFLDVTVEPGADLGPYANTATASGDSPGGTTATDVSDNAAITDENGVNGPGDDSDPTPVSFVEGPRIGVAKAVTAGPTNNGDDTYSLSYSMVVENAGDVLLSDISVTESLATTFADATAFTVDSLTSSDFTVNTPDFNGDSDSELLATGNTLAVGAQGTISLTVTITPGADLGPYDNTVVATGTSPSSQVVTDDSVDGADPDADNDSNPNNDQGPTSVTFTEDAEIGVAKAIISGPTNNGDGTYSLTYEITVENSGDVNLSDVQIDEPLANTFAGASYNVDALSSVDFTVAIGVFDGDSNPGLLVAGNVLNAGDSGTVQLTVTVTPGANLGPYDNTATASGTAPSGAMPSDDSTDGATPDANGDGDPGNDSIPTPTTFSEDAEIGIAKAVVAGPTNNGDGSYTLTYRIVVENSGDVDLIDVQIDEPLATTFAGATFIVDALTSTDLSVASGVFDGIANTSLLTAGNNLAVGTSATLDLTVTVTPGANLGPYDNTATAIGTSPSGAMPSDTSTDGVQPDADNDGDPGNDNIPTSTSFNEVAAIGVAKAVTAGPTNNADGSYTLTYGIIVENFGDVQLNNVQIDEPLVVTFAGASFTVDALTSPTLTVAAGVFDGDANRGLLAAGNTLSVGETASIDVTVTVIPGADLGPYENTVIATGTSPSGAMPSDTSVDGIDPDSNGNGDPGDDTSPTPVGFSEAPALGVAKLATDAQPNFDNTFTTSVTVLVENDGDVVINDVAIDEPLATNFAPATVVAVENLLVSGDIAAVRATFDGVTDTNLVADGQSLPAGGSALFTFDVTVDIDAGGQCVATPLSNTVEASGTSPSGAVLIDQSMSGGDPDPDGDGDASNNAEATLITFITGVDATVSIIEEILPGEVLTISVADADDNRDNALIETVNVVVTNIISGEQEIVVLTETAAASGEFEGSLPTVEATTTGTNNDGILSVAFEDTYDVAFSDTLSSAGCVTVVTDAGLVLGLATLVGSAWLDSNTDDNFDAGEMPLEGWIIEVTDAAGNVVATVNVAPDGSYTVPDLIPGDGYSVRLIHPDSGVTFGTIDDISLPPNTTVLDQNLPIDPSGVFYDAVSRETVPGVTARLVDAAGNPLPDVCLLPGQQNQITADDGFYRFDVVLGADPACPSGASFFIEFDVPDGFQDGLSDLIPPRDGTLDPTGQGDPLRVGDSINAPVGGQATTYYTGFDLQDNDPMVVFNHIPLDPLGVETNSVRLTKRVAQPTTSVGSLVSYTITIENLSPVAIPGIEVVDTLPPGFSYVENSATLDGVSNGFQVTGPRPLLFDDIDLAPGQLRTLRYILRVGAGVTAGDYVNTAVPTLNGGEIGNEDTATIEVIADPDFEETTIIGKVWLDHDGDGWQDRADATGLVLSGGPFGASRDIGDLDGRVSESENLDRHQIVLEVAYSDDPITLTSREGSVLTLQSNGDVTETHRGDVSNGRNAQRLSIERERIFDAPHTTTKRITRSETVVEESVVDPVRFASGQDDIPASYVEQLKVVLDSLQSQRNVRLSFVGHTDNQALSARSAAIYTDNQGLSESRARRVAHFIQQALALPDSAIEISGRGDTQPLASNATADGMAFNRRVEIGVIYERDEQVEESIHELSGPQPTDRMHVRITNHGLQEPGIAGVRLATVEGLVVETDSEGRYHIAAIDGGFMERGRNFIVKVDPATLPRGSEFTTENPRVKRITQGLLNQFDFGVRGPRLRATVPELQTFEFTPAFFTTDGIGIRSEYRFLIDELEESLVHFGGGRVVLLTPDTAKQRALATRRAEALMHLLRNRLPMKVWRNTEVFVMASNDQASLGKQSLGFAKRVAEVLLGFLITTAHADDCSIQHCVRDDVLVSRSGMTDWSDSNPDAPLMHPTDGRFRIGLPGGGVVWATEDAAAMQPRLIVAGPKYVAAQQQPATLVFVGYSNYAGFIDNFELRIYRDSDRDRLRPVAAVQPIAQSDAFTSSIQFQWQPAVQSLLPGTQFAYELVATSHDGLRDVTQEGLLRVVTADEFAESEAEAATRYQKQLERSPSPDFPIHNELGVPDHEAKRLLLATYGRSQLRRQNIVLHGARVRMQGYDFPVGHSLRVNGQWLPIDAEGKFAAEYLLPVGDTWAQVAVQTADGATWLKDIPVSVTGEHHFLVALADFTAAENDLSGSLEPLSANDRYAEDTLIEGRVAYYLKAKIRGKYLLTSQLDSREEQLDDILGNLDERDPRTLFRRIDPDRYYPVYGDDSTTINDADTQGRLYLRLEWDKSNVVWGNFRTQIDDNEFVQYRRTLYGAQLDWRNVKTTQHDEAKSRFSVFGSEAQTVLGHSEFLGTGGSLYYLRHLDIVPGSDQVRVEFRDVDTNRVVEVVDLIRGRDYELDELQGRLILSEPLLQIAQQSAPSIVRDGPIDGNLAILVADYEYLPVGFDADEIAAGIRGKHWIGDNISVGGSYVSEGRGSEDYTLAGADIAVTDGKGSYIKVEAASSEATQTERFYSNDGGLSFGTLNAAVNENRSGEALGLEARINLQGRGITDSPSTIAAWWRRTDDQFSIARRDDGVDVYEQGLEWLYDWSERGRLALRATSVERELQSEQNDIMLQADFGLSDNGTLSGELRQLSQESLAIGGASVDATLAAMRYAYRFGSKAEVYAIGQITLENDGGDYDNNDLGTIGMTYAVTERTSLLAEASSGHRGDGATLTLSHDVNSNHNVYGTFTHSTDRTDNPLGGLPASGNSRDRLLPGNTLALGHRSRISNQLDVFNETMAADVRGPVSLGHVFGLNWNTPDGFRVGFTLQRSDVNADLGVVEREAATLTGGYRSARFNWTSRIELRDDEAAFGADSVRQWASINRLDWRLGEDYRVLTRFNYADTEDAGSFRDDTKLVEGGLGLAYRPVEHNRLNWLAKYTYLYDLTSSAQADLFGSLASRTDQRSHILSVEGVKRFGPRWSLGGKLAQRVSELRIDRSTGVWFDSTTNFAALRLRYHLVRNWDAMAEYRWLEVEEARNRREGWLIGVDRHVGEHFKVGIGYNFTDFSDDLTQLDYEFDGVFLNVLGKY
ncbi:MAG: OmpA family protein [Pseudomonadota bacterium]